MNISNNKTNISATRGYTLLEILIVLLLGTILLTVVPPLFSKSERVLIKQTAEKIALKIHQARIRSITQNTVHEVGIDTFTKTISAGENDLAPLIIPTSIEFEVKTAATNVDPSHASIYFYPDGSSSGAVMILQSDRYRYEVSINWLTGNTLVLKQAS